MGTPIGWARADIVAQEGGWTWRRVAALTPGDVQVFAGRRMTVASVRQHGPKMLVTYKDAPERWWNAGTEVGVVDA